MRRAAAPRRGQLAMDAGARRAPPPPRVMASGTVRSDRWMVTRATRSAPPTNSMATSDTPATSASISVWPGQGWPAAASDSLLRGAVTRASTRAGQGVAGGRAARLSAAARPAAGEVTPSAHGPRRRNVHDPRPQALEGAQPEARARARRGRPRVRTRPCPPAGRSAWASAFKTTSGPIPAGSPTVSASRVIDVGYQTARTWNRASLVPTEIPLKWAPA